jgi:hypothetical protein
VGAMASVNIEIEDEMKEHIETLAEQMGVSVAEWCAFAVSQQLMVNEAMNTMFSDIEQLFLQPEQINLESFKNLGNIIDLSDLTKKEKP